MGPPHARTSYARTSLIYATSINLTRHVPLLLGPRHCPPTAFLRSTASLSSLFALKLTLPGSVNCSRRKATALRWLLVNLEYRDMCEDVVARYLVHPAAASMNTPILLLRKSSARGATGSQVLATSCSPSPNLTLPPHAVALTPATFCTVS